MPIKHILLAVLVAAIWGCNFLFVKLGVKEIPPLFLCALRFFLAAFPAVFFLKRPNLQMLKLIAMYGLIMFGLQFSLMFSSFAFGMTAGMASILNQTQILFSVLFAVIFLGEFPNFWQILGGFTALTGIVLVGQHLDHHVSLIGFFLVIGAAMTWGLGNLAAKKAASLDVFMLIAWGSLIACFPLTLLSFVLEGPTKIGASLHHISYLGLLSLAYIVYVSTWLGYGVWSWLIKYYPVTSIVPFTLLVPVFGLLGGAIFLGETLATWQLMASSLIIVGLGCNLIGPRLQRRYQKMFKRIDVRENTPQF